MIKASVILLLACCVIPALPRRSAAERHLLWAAALGAAAMVPLLNLFLPFWQPAWARDVMAVLPAPFAASPSWSTDQGVDIVIHVNGIESTTWILSYFLPVLWATGTLVTMLMLAVEGLKLARLRLSARRVSDARWHQVAGDVAHALELEQPPLLLQSAQAVVPMTWGIWHPRVLLPACATEWSDDRKRVVLAHELAHVRRGDWVVQILAELICAVYWFHPLFWVAHNRLCRESEQAADDVALNLGIDGSDYAAHLLEIVRTIQTPPRAWSPTVAMARPSHLEHRFAALLSSGADRRPVTRWNTCAGLGLVVLLVLPIAAMSGPRSNTSIEVRTSNLPAVMETAPAPNEARAVPAIRHMRVSALTANVTAPQILEYTTPPLYSDEARARGLEGIVTVEASVDVDGSVHGVRVLKGLGSGLDQNAMVALRQWRFLAGTQDGVPAEMHAEIDIEFTLRNEAVNLLIANEMATRVGPGMTPPRAVRTADVWYPRTATNRTRPGTVVLDVVLLEDGTPKIIRILRSLDPERDESAVRAFERWRFTPAMKDGNPVKVRMNAEVNFHE